MNLISTSPLYHIRSKFLVLLFEITKPVYRFLFKHNKQAWRLSLEDLSQFDTGTLGKDLSSFMLQEGFEIEPKLESHDVSHVLLQFSTDVPNEIAMQFFYAGNGKRSYYTWFTVMTGFLILPEYYELFFSAYQNGKQATPIGKWQFEHLLREQTNTLRAQIFKNNKENTLYI